MIQRKQDSGAWTHRIRRIRPQSSLLEPELTLSLEECQDLINSVCFTQYPRERRVTIADNVLMANPDIIAECSMPEFTFPYFFQSLDKRGQSILGLIS